MKEKSLREYNKLNDRVVRWDEYRINQFSYANNLLLTLNLGFIGFFIMQIGFKIECKCFFIILQVHSFLLLLVSFITGLLLVFNRLKDFSLTARLTKKRKKKFEKKNAIKHYSSLDITKIDSLSKKTDALGKRSWRLFKYQIWTFATGTILGVVYLVLKSNIGC